MKIEQADHLSAEHLSMETLVGLLYEAAPPNAHLAACPHCQSRLQAMKSVQLADADRQPLQGASLSPGILATQRADIYTRLDSRATFGSRWLWAGAPVAAAAALLILVNIGVFQTARQRVAEVSEAEVASVTDAAQGNHAENDTLYSDIYQTLSSGAPAGVHTVAGMFDVAAQKTEAAKN